MTHDPVPGRGWDFVVPDYTPPLLNDLLGGSKAAAMRAARLKRECGDLFAVYARAADVPTVGEFGAAYRPRRHVGLTVHGWGGPGGRPDPDAFLKASLDALKAARLIVDDCKHWCGWSPPELVISRERATIVVMMDLSFPGEMPRARKR